MLNMDWQKYDCEKCVHYANTEHWDYPCNMCLNAITDAKRLYEYKNRYEEREISNDVNLFYERFGARCSDCVNYKQCYEEDDCSVHNDCIMWGDNFKECGFSLDFAHDVSNGKKVIEFD